MRFTAILGEAVRDLHTGTTRLLLFGLAFAAVTTAGVTVSMSDQRRALAEAEAFRSSGASVTVLRAEERIDGGACDSLAKLDGVVASGALRDAGSDIVPSSLPGSPLPTKEVTTGFPRVVQTQGEWRAGGVILSRQAIDVVGLSSLRALATHEGDAAVRGSFDYPDDGRQGGLGFSALVPQPRDQATAFDECWVDIWPEDEQISGLIRTVVRPGESKEGERPTTLQLNGSLGSHFAGREDVANGLGRFAPAGAAAAGLLLGVVAVRLRRLELASARHAGVNRGAQALGQLLQGGAWILSGSILATPLLVALTRSDDATAAPALGLCGLAAIVSAVLGSVAGIVGTTLVTREKHFFRYFKER